ncbi:MAG: DUF1292 domain-containing protein [Oscillospiraceae bacterium]|nr:DUF1292 domain-containing protein [Oscillospiraceae bacterium]
MGIDTSDTNLISLTDEEGKAQNFEPIDVYEENGEKYYALLPEGSDEFVVLKVEFDENGEEDSLCTIESDEEYERIGKIFIERYDSMFE